MRTLYFDLIGGISGDMVVGALLDIGVDFRGLCRELKKVKISGYILRKKSVSRDHVKAIKFDVAVQRNANYSYREIIRLIKHSKLSPAVKNNILKIYQALCAAETKAHGHQHKDINFEQLGDIDSLIDITATCICLDKLQVNGLYYSLIPLNKNIAPATTELLLNKKMYFTDLIYENVTPTGMAILSALGSQLDYSLRSVLMMQRCGYGAGALDPPEVSNVLRVIEFKDASFGVETDHIQVIEANIDDMNPQFFEYIFEQLFQIGALDAFIESIYMKKTRPGFLLTVLSKAENLGKITDLILKETTTLGVRFYSVSRLTLARKIEEVDFRHHKVRVKSARLPDGSFKTAPEYEDCKVLAAKLKFPLSKIYNEVKQKADKKWRSRV